MVTTRATRRQVCRYKIPMLRKAITRMRRAKKVKRSEQHPPVGKMKAQDVIKYLYSTADSLHWDWASIISGPEKKRVAKKCKAAPGAGVVAQPPSQILPKRPSGKLTSWQSVVKQVFQDAANKDKSVKDKMALAKKIYATKKKPSRASTRVKAAEKRKRSVEGSGTEKKNAVYSF